MSGLWILLLMAGLGGAWYLGFSRRLRYYKKYSLPRDYLVGLNFLLNEEPDKAVDVFIKMLEVDSDTVETHLAVGKLFRRRGEVDRAIRIHQNLIARPQLEKIYRDQSLFELGQDYLSAGMLDRAERIFQDMIHIKEYTISALRSLMDIYQQEKNWENAIKMAKKLESAAFNDMQPIIAQYYCELADAALSKGQWDQSARYLKDALRADLHCVRASLLQAKVEIKQGDYRSAIRYLKHIKEQNPDYLSEAMDSLALCYEAVNDHEALVTYLMQIMQEHPYVPVAMILAEHLRRQQGDQVATDFVTDYVRRYPSMLGLHLYIHLHVNSKEGRLREDLLILQHLTKKLLADKPDYRCISCGFSGKSLHWLCPGCKTWSSVKPAHRLEEYV